MTSKHMMNFATLLQQIDSVTAKKSYEKDENFWKPTKDKAGNAAAIIRFLPSSNTDDVPFVRIYQHNFKDAGTGRWYIENSLTTIGGQDLVSTVNKELWNTGLEENKKLSSLRKRKLSYIANILVVKDLGNPEQNGKVMKYKFGAKIWEKICAAAKPDAMLGEEPISAFCPINGADFLVKMAYNESSRQYNYDASKFNSKKPLFDGDDDKIEEVLSRCFDIQAEIAPDKFKSAEELNKHFLWVTGGDEKGPKTTQDSETEAELAMLSKMVNAPSKTVRKAPPMPVMDSGSDDESDDNFFRSLIED